MDKLINYTYYLIKKSMKNKNLARLVQKLNQNENPQDENVVNPKIEFLPDELAENVLGGSTNQSCSCGNSGCSC